MTRPDPSQTSIALFRHPSHEKKEKLLAVTNEKLVVNCTESFHPCTSHNPVLLAPEGTASAGYTAPSPPANSQQPPAKMFLRKKMFFIDSPQPPLPPLFPTNCMIDSIDMIPSILILVGLFARRRMSPRFTIHGHTNCDSGTITVLSDWLP